MKTITSNFTRTMCLSSLIILSSSFANSLFAKRDASADLSYVHLSGNLYRFHCTYYRDCYAIPAPTSIVMNLLSLNCGVNQNDTLMRLSGNGVEISNNCPGYASSCDGGNLEGIEKYEYEREINIPGQCPDWVFSLSDCCWNAAITSIQIASVYTEARLNNLLTDNSSPRFLDDPVMLQVRPDQDFHYNNGAVDPDGDSLVYSLVPALQYANTNVIYLPGYDFMHPVRSTPPLTFNGVTGDLFVHPDTIQNCVIASMVQDYRNGVLMGSIMRNYVMFCYYNTINHYPVLSGINGTTAHSIPVLTDHPICFSVFSSDADASDSLTMTWDHAISGAAFTSNNAVFPAGEFCWTPQVSDARSAPYLFCVTIRDNNCPLNNEQVYSYSIYVTVDSSLVFLNTNTPDEDFIFTVLPNPSRGVITIQSAEKFSQLNIYNVLGECILKNEFENTVDISSQPEGIYFVEAITPDGKITTEKIIKK